MRAALGPIGTEAEDLADLLPDPTFDAIRMRYHTMDLQVHDAQAYAYEAHRRAHEATDRVMAKGRELAALAAEVARAELTSSRQREREIPAQQEAQAACTQLVELDAQVRVVRNRADGFRDARSAARPLTDDRSASSRKR